MCFKQSWMDAVVSTFCGDWKNATAFCLSFKICMLVVGRRNHTLQGKYNHIKDRWWVYFPTSCCPIDISLTLLTISKTCFRLKIYYWLILFSYYVNSSNLLFVNIVTLWEPMLTIVNTFPFHLISVKAVGRLWEDIWAQLSGPCFLPHAGELWGQVEDVSWHSGLDMPQIRTCSADALSPLWHRKLRPWKDKRPSTLMASS